MKSLLEVRGLAAGYDGQEVVHGVDLHVANGEVVALLGANGAGKSTTMRTLSGLLPHMAGALHLDGNDVTGRPAHWLAAAGMGFVPEGRGLARALSVEENFRLVKVPALDPYALFPELRELRSRRVALLSGGEQQMVAVARALTMVPRVLLVDELSFGLGPRVVTRLLSTLRELASSTGLGVLLVEQHVQQALQTADRAYIMHRGEIVIHAPAAQLREDRALVESGYLGDDNPGRLRTQRGRAS